jgi:hypothetical protein
MQIKTMVKIGATLLAALLIFACEDEGGSGAPVNKDGWVDKVTLSDGGVAAYKFTLPADSTWSDYTKLSADYLVDEENFDKNFSPYRIYGVYTEAHMELFQKEGDYYVIQNFSTNVAETDTNGPYIFHQDALGVPVDFEAEIGAWFTVTVNLNEAEHYSTFNEANIPAGDATGPFILGLGMRPYNGDDPGPTFYVKNIILSNDDGSKKVAATDLGLGAPAFIGYIGRAFASVKAPDPAPAAE